MPNYGCPKYWDERYQNAGMTASFDWLESYMTLKSLLVQFMNNKDIRILVLGCGNAEFSEDIYDDGYKNIVNVDISSVVIRQMQQRNEELRPEMEWITMDITDMSQFETGSFDLAIDKSTIDALLCGDDSFLKVAQMLKETQRVLKVGGHYFAVSYGKPESRSFHFVQPFLSFENREFILYDSSIVSQEDKEEKSHYIYVSRKLEDADELSDRYYPECIKQLKIDAEIQRQLEEEEEANKPEDDLSEEEDVDGHSGSRQEPAKLKEEAKTEKDVRADEKKSAKDNTSDLKSASSLSATVSDNDTRENQKKIKSGARK